MPKVIRARFKPRDATASACNHVGASSPSSPPFFSHCGVGVRDQRFQSPEQLSLGAGGWGGGAAAPGVSRPPSLSSHRWKTEPGQQVLQPHAAELNRGQTWPPEEQGSPQAGL